MHLSSREPGDFTESGIDISETRESLRRMSPICGRGMKALWNRSWEARSSAVAVILSPNRIHPVNRLFASCAHELANLAADRGESLKNVVLGWRILRLKN